MSVSIQYWHAKIFLFPQPLISLSSRPSVETSLEVWSSTPDLFLCGQSIFVCFAGSPQVMLIRRWWLPPSWPHCPHPLWCSTLPLLPQVTSQPQCHSTLNILAVETTPSNTDSTNWGHSLYITPRVTLTLSQVKRGGTVGRKAHHQSVVVSLPRHRLMRLSCLCVYLYSSNRGDSYSIISTIPLSFYTCTLTQAQHLPSTVQPWPYHHSSFCCFHCGCHITMPTMPDCQSPICFIYLSQH